MDQNTGIKVKIQLNEDHLVTIWENIGTVINKGIPSNSDRAFLGEVMADIAEKYDAIARDEDEDHTFHTNVGKARAIWHSCNIVIKNNFYKDRGREIFTLETMSAIAPVIDEAVDGPQKPKLTLE